MAFEPQTWIADRYLGHAEAGRTRPLRLGCSRPADEAPAGRDNAEFFTKAVGLPEITNQSLFSEMVGNALSREFGIATPEPAFVELTFDFVQLLRAVDGTTLNPGIGVGTRSLGSGLTPPTFGRMSEDQLQQAARIYLFDLSFQNPDRRSDNPNCLAISNDIVGIDFESCFSFLYPIFGRKAEPWEVSSVGIAARHLFHDQLRKADVDWPMLAGRIGNLVDVLDSWSGWVQDSWKSWADQVRGHIIALRDHRQEFLIEIARSLT